MKILVLNGPSINMLGIREPEVYGTQSYETLCKMIREHCRARGVDCELFQSNHEGALVDKIQEAYGNTDGIVINPAAYTHTSIALLDVLLAVRIPAVEVHITNVSRREAFRQVSYVRQACIASISGRGLQGYLDAVDLLLEHLKTEH